MTKYFALRKTSQCLWEAEIPMDNIYSFAPSGGGAATVTCVQSEGRKAYFNIYAEFSQTDKTTTWTLEWKIPWDGVDSAGDPGEYEIMTVLIEQENDDCQMRECPLSIPLSLTITGNAGFTNAEGYFNSSYWTLDKFCELFRNSIPLGTFRNCLDYIAVVYSMGGDLTTVSCSDKGKCCLPGGGCRDTNKDQCVRLGGTFTPGERCCVSTPFGTDCSGGCKEEDLFACCFPDASCIDLTKAECSERGGTSGNLKCASTTCAGTGKCCLPSGDCILTTQADCTSKSGTYSGDGTKCTDGCAGDPTGACCLDDGSCVETTNANCTAQGGNYQGDATTCATSSCGSCNKCEPGSTPPGAVTLIVSGGKSSTTVCNCSEINGAFTLTPSSENPCSYEYSFSCSGGGTIKYIAELYGKLVDEQPAPGWAVTIMYEGQPVHSTTSLFINCSGGGDSAYRSGRWICLTTPVNSNIKLELIV